ncbi:MAG: hypothetical protein ABIY50_00495 [Ignavibacteria bacterium]
MILLSVLTGCRDETVKTKVDQKMVEPESNRMQPSFFKGMYIDSSSAGIFYDCNNNVAYNISEKGETAAVKKAYNNIPEKKHGEKIYLELEGFISTQPNFDGRLVDSVLVITRFFLFNRAGKCD